MLLCYTWPGNVRELENFMERMSILCDEKVIRPEDLPEKILREVGHDPKPPVLPTPAAPQGFAWPALRDMQDKGMGLKEFLDEVEERLLTEALSLAGGVKNQAAEILGIKRTTLIEKLKKKEPGIAGDAGTIRLCRRKAAKSLRAAAT